MIKRSPVHLKEKARMKAMMEQIVAMERVDRAAAHRLRIAFSLTEKGFQDRCRKVRGSDRPLPLQVDGYVAEYWPRTGQVTWSVHPNQHMGANALAVSKHGARVIYGEGGKAHSAPRLIYAAVHGSIPENHMVFCADNDPANLKPNNLRTHVHRIVHEPLEIPDEIRAKLRALREAREARSQS